MGLANVLRLHGAHGTAEFGPRYSIRPNDVSTGRVIMEDRNRTRSEVAGGTSNRSDGRAEGKYKYKGGRRSQGSIPSLDDPDDRESAGSFRGTADKDPPGADDDDGTSDQATRSPA